MNGFEIAGGIILIIVNLFLVLFVMMQEGNASNPQAVMGGGNESYYDKNRTSTKERFLYKLTKIGTIVFFVVTFAMDLVFLFLK